MSLGTRVAKYRLSGTKNFSVRVEKYLRRMLSSRYPEDDRLAVASANMHRRLVSFAITPFRLLTRPCKTDRRLNKYLRWNHITPHNWLSREQTWTKSKELLPSLDPLLADFPMVPSFNNLLLGLLLIGLPILMICGQCSNVLTKKGLVTPRTMLLGGDDLLQNDLKSVSWIVK